MTRIDRAVLKYCNFKWRWVFLAACGLAWPALAQQAATPPDRQARPPPTAEQIAWHKLTLGCGAEGRLALRVATAYFELNGRSKDATLAYAAQSGDLGTALARDLFPQADAGTITGAPRFATQHVIKCLGAANFPLDREVTVEMSDLCWARSDVIVQSQALKQAGRTREQAEGALRQRYTNQVAFPSVYLKSINGLVYDLIDSQDAAADRQNAFYWDCLVASVRAASRK
jgi:hypothetical protein